MVVRKNVCIFQNIILIQSDAFNKANKVGSKLTFMNISTSMLKHTHLSASEKGHGYQIFPGIKIKKCIFIVKITYSEADGMHETCLVLPRTNATHFDIVLSDISMKEKNFEQM